MENLSIDQLKLIQFVQTLLVFVLPALLVALIAGRHLPDRHRAWTWLHLDRAPQSDTLVWMALMVLAGPGVNLLLSLNQQLHLPWPEWEQYFRDYEDNAAMITRLFLKPRTDADLAVNLLLMAILPAFAEELFFRGTLLRWRSHVAVWTVAILFSAVHMQFYGFIPRMLLGAMLGYAFVWTRNLWVPMLMHATNNAMAVLAYHISYRLGADPESMSAVGAESTWWIGALSIVLTLVALVWLHRYYIRLSQPNAR